MTIADRILKEALADCASNDLTATQYSTLLALRLTTALTMLESGARVFVNHVLDAYPADREELTRLVDKLGLPSGKRS